jgi:hypothetical protein
MICRCTMLMAELGRTLVPTMIEKGTVMILPPAALVILAEQRQHDRLEEAAQWRLAKRAEASCAEDCGWRWSDVKSAFANLARVTLSWLVGIPSRTGAMPAASQHSLWQA